VGSKFDFNEAPYPFDVHLLKKLFSCAVSPVVDNKAVCKFFPQSVLVEIEKINHGEKQFPFDSLSSAIESQDLVVFVFGNLRAGLQQLCVRRIIEHVCFLLDLHVSSGFLGILFYIHYNCLQIFNIAVIQI